MTYENSILIVEDEKELCQVLRENLKDHASKIFTAYNGQEALDILKNNTVDAVITDLNMPVMHGVEFISQMRNMGLDTPCIALTAYCNKENLLAALRLGVTDFLEKPYQMAELPQIIKKVFKQNEHKRSLEELHKVASLGEMVGCIAHEINNPLTVIYGKALEIRKHMENKNGLDQTATLKAVDKIEATTMKIAKIVKGLKNFTRNSEDEPFEEILLKDILDEAITLCQERFEKNGVSLSVEDFSQKLIVYCRGVQMIQALINLLNNAYDAVEELPEKWVHIVVKDLSNAIQISIIDSGSGISEEMQKKIFQPFFTTKNPGKGTGLGLGIVKNIIDAHRGKFYIDSFSKNTKFVIELPMAVPQKIST